MTPQSTKDHHSKWWSYSYKQRMEPLGLSEMSPVHCLDYQGIERRTHGTAHKNDQQPSNHRQFDLISLRESRWRERWQRLERQLLDHCPGSNRRDSPKTGL